MIATDIALKYGWSVSLRTSTRLWNKSSDLAIKLRERRVAIFIDNTIEHVMSAGPSVNKTDIGLSFGAPWIFPKSWIKHWNGRIFNSHARMLPRHRGAGGASWLILMNDRKGMASIHELTAGLDEGPIVAKKLFKYPANLKFPREYDLIDQRQTTFLLKKWLPQAFRGEINKSDQDHSISTYWPRLSTDKHSWVNWEWTANEIVAFCRAFDSPYAGAQTFLKGEIIRLKSACLIDKSYHHPFQSGLIFRIYNNKFIVAAKGGSISFNADVGIAFRLGDRLVTPASILQAALATRVTYLPDGLITTTSSLPDRSS